jgi:hypothetical protein
MIPELSVLPAAQRLLWSELAQVPKHFVLYGGTAVALHYGHRSSVDFDFFTSEPVNPEDLMRSLPFLRGGKPVRVSANTLDVEVTRGEVNSHISLRALSYFSDGDLPSLPKQVKEHLMAAVNSVIGETLPEFEPLPGGLAPLG